MTIDNKCACKKLYELNNISNITGVCDVCEGYNQRCSEYMQILNTGIDEFDHYKNKGGKYD